MSRRDRFQTDFQRFSLGRSLTKQTAIKFRTDPTTGSSQLEVIQIGWISNRNPFDLNGTVCKYFRGAQFECGFRISDASDVDITSESLQVSDFRHAGNRFEIEFPVTSSHPVDDRHLDRGKIRVTNPAVTLSRSPRLVRLPERAC